MVETHACKSPRTHVRERPDIYVGSKNAEPRTCLILHATPAAAVTSAGAVTDAAADASAVTDAVDVTATGSGSGPAAGSGGFSKRGVSASWRSVLISAAFDKAAFDEIWTNALDRLMRDATVTKLSVQVHQDTGTIVVKNDGKGIPVKKMRVSGTDEELWTPAVIMSRMLSGSNFDESESAAGLKPRYTGGRNGLGAKLTGILSTRFSVDTCDADEKKRFRQTWTNGLRTTAGESVTEFSKDKGGTTITYTPDYAWFGMPGLTDDAVALIRTRVLTSAAGNTARPVAVEWVHGAEKITLPAGLGLGLKDLAGLLSRTEQKKMAAESVMQPGAVSARATIVAVPRVSECAEALGFVNSVRADRGTHVRWAQTRIADAVMKRLRQGKHADLPLTAGMVAKSLTLLVSVLVDSPAFDSQTKDELNTPARAWGFDWVVSDKFADALLALVGDKLVADAVKKQNKGAAAALGVTSSRRAVPVIPKYDPAEDLGKGGCTLGLAEGDSAKALLVSMHLGKKFGIFPLRGKLKNARGLTPAQLAANSELGNLIKIIGLQPGVDYTDKAARARLFYANVMLFVDQDPDGSHIAGLLLNFFAAQWPTLLAAIPNFITRFRTPLLAVVPSGPTFFSQAEFEDWRAGAGGGRHHRVKYYKGLGTSTAAEGRQYAANKERHVQSLTWTGQACEAAVDAAFNEKTAAARRTLITAAITGDTVPVENLSAMTYAQFVAHDLVHFFVYANRRALPCFVDGLKVAQRKVLHALLHRAGNAEMRVCDAVGWVSGYSHYHHGDAALGETIMHMMQNHVGSNNINLLYPAGQAGTRLADRGTHASTRYVHTCLEPITAALFNKEDLALLQPAIEDGEEAEPLFFVPVVPLLLINGAEGLGAGWSTTVHPRDPRAVFAATRAWVTADAAGGDGPAAAARVPLPPHWDGWTGTVTPVAEKPGTYTVKGVAERLPDGRVHVTELPPGTWTDDYLTYVRGREELSVKHTPDEAKVDIYVTNLTLPEEQQQGADALLANLKLVDCIRDTNMHGFLGEKLCKADAAHDVLNMHAVVRLEYYKKRQAAQLAALATDVQTLQHKLEFITSVIDRSFVPFFKTKAQLLAELAERYPAAMVPVLAATPTDKYCSDEVTALRASLVEAQRKREVLAAKTPHALWHADLDHLEAVYADFKTEKLERYCALVRPKAQKRKL